MQSEAIQKVKTKWGTSYFPEKWVLSTSWQLLHQSAVATWIKYKALQYTQCTVGQAWASLAHEHHLCWIFVQGFAEPLQHNISTRSSVPSI